VETQAAVLWEYGADWEVEDLSLDSPQQGEVLVELTASGLCHSDEHVRVGDLPMDALPAIGGHEGAGIVREVGPGVTKVREGDHVVLSFIPACGDCSWCASGHQNLCDKGAGINIGLQEDGTARHHVGGQDARLMCMLGTFSRYTVVNQNSVVRIDDDIPLDKAALVGCGVTTGWGTAVHGAQVKPGDTVVVLGIGGVGANALQGAKIAGATQIVAVDPAPYNREMATVFGATHTFASVAEAAAALPDMTRGRMAESAIITIDVVTPTILADGMSLVGKLGKVCLTSLGSVSLRDIQLPVFELTAWQKQIVGCLFGNSNPRADIPKLLELYRQGELLLDELVTGTYRLDQVNEGYQAMRSHRTVRGVILFE
jgi:S-(hydroxymethyl)glutathione dehydrogenase/alcohol dehydrogenase